MDTTWNQCLTDDDYPQVFHKTTRFCNLFCMKHILYRMSSLSCQDIVKQSAGETLTKISPKLRLKYCCDKSIQRFHVI